MHIFFTNPFNTSGKIVWISSFTELAAHWKFSFRYLISFDFMPIGNLLSYRNSWSKNLSTTPRLIEIRKIIFILPKNFFSSQLTSIAMHEILLSQARRAIECCTFFLNSRTDIQIILFYLYFCFCGCSSRKLGSFL